MERIMCSVSKTHGIIVPDISRIDWKYPPDLGRRLVAKSDGVAASTAGWVRLSSSPASATVAF